MSGCVQRGEEEAHFAIRNMASGAKLRFEAKVVIRGRLAVMDGGGTKRGIRDSAKPNDMKVNCDTPRGEEGAFFTIRNMVGLAELRFEAKVFVEGE